MTFPNVVQLAIPFFVLLVFIEMAMWKARRRVRYETRDAAASLIMGLGNVIAGALTGGILYALFAWVHSFRVFDIGYAWWAFPIALLANDFVFYCGHRLSHSSRWFWANHVSHHSSQHYNLTTALRQPWAGLIAGVYLLSLPVVWLGVPPALYFFAGGINLTYQFWIHTEAVDRLGPLEWVLNTPSHHRVHHATNPRYLDANHGGIFILWDRLFGTFVAEDPADPPRYGLIKNLRTFNPLWIAFHEYLAIARDVWRARSLSEAWGYVFGRPGWSPDGSRKTTADLQAEWRRLTQARPQLEPTGPRSGQALGPSLGPSPGGIAASAPALRVAVAAPQPTAAPAP
jgi:sterol desaturase/sphingolipid hydroxylase (fatty acid hydroxylase superfamily)